MACQGCCAALQPVLGTQLATQQRHKIVSEMTHGNSCGAGMG